MKSMNSLSRVMKPPRPSSLSQKQRRTRPTRLRSPPRHAASGRSTVGRGLMSVKHRPATHPRKPSDSARSSQYASLSSSSRRPEEHISRKAMDRMSSGKHVQDYEKREPIRRSGPQKIPASSTHRQMPPPTNMSRTRPRSPNIAPGNYSGPANKKIRREGSSNLSSPNNNSMQRFAGQDHSHSHSNSNTVRDSRSASSLAPYPLDHRADYPPVHRNNRLPYNFVKKPVDGYGVTSLEGSHHSKALPESTYSHDQKRNRGPSGSYPLSQEKHYGLTLDERFRAVTGNAAQAGENRIQYTKEDLENITIDIKRSSRDFSPTVRRIMNPSEVKLVRRPTEGHRPIFDREEIKQSPRDLREEASYAQRMYSSGHPGSESSYRLNYKEMANYEITSHKFDSYHAPPSTTVIPSGVGTLYEKWQKLEGQRPRIGGYDRDELNRGHQEKPHVPAYNKSSTYPSQQFMARDFRSDGDYRPKLEYHPPSSNKQLLSNAPAFRRKDTAENDARQRLSGRRLKSREQPPPNEFKNWPPGSSSRNDSRLERPRERSHTRGPPPRHGSGKDHPAPWDRNQSHGTVGKFPEFPPREEKFKYQTWMHKPDVPPKGSGYYENIRDNDLYRGSSQRGFRGRGYRGSSTSGVFRGRGSPKGRNIPARRKGSYRD